MTRQELTEYISDEYGVDPDYPFRMDDVTCVFRHADNRKWFGIAMVIPYRTAGISRDGNVDILNVKCDPVITGSLRGKPGFLPAYHMNKDRWITILLDGSAEPEDIKALLAMSYGMTAAKIRRMKRVHTDETDQAADRPGERIRAPREEQRAALSLTGKPVSRSQLRQKGTEKD